MNKKELLFSLKFAWYLFFRNIKTSIFIVLIFSLILSLPTLTKSVNDGFGVKIKKDLREFIGDFVITLDNNYDYLSLKNKLNNLPFISHYLFVQMTNVVVKDKENNSLATTIYIINGFDWFTDNIDLKNSLKKGDVEPGKEGVYLGQYLVKGARIKMFPELLNVEPGEKVIIKIGNKVREFKVLGIYSKNLPSLDRFVLANSKFFDFKPNKVIIYLKNTNNMDFIQKELQNEFPKFKIRSIKDEMATVDSFLRTFDIASNISFFFGTIIAVIIIYSLISINVKNKRTEIGILRAIGIKESNIILAYLFLTIIYLTFSFIFSLLILKLFEIYFQNNPIHSPFGLINPFIDYKFFVISFLKLLIILLFISYLPIRSVVKENLINQIRS